MKYPTVPLGSVSRQMLDTFKGYNHNPRIGDGEFFHMENLTSDRYPVLAPRGKRGTYATPAAAGGLIAKDALCYTDGGSFVMNGYPIDLGLSQGPKQLVSMGAYVIILPDKKYINTADITDRGDIDAKVQTAAPVAVTLTRANGQDYTQYAAGTTAPTDPVNMALWVDTSTQPAALKQWSGSAGRWVSIGTSYVKLSSPGIGAPFGQYDGVTVSGLAGTPLEALEGGAVIWDRGDDYIVIPGIVESALTLETAVTVERAMPQMDFITESGNRLWGCRYGTANDGRIVNEIYCSKLGDFKNWSCFMGLSTDSYTASVGTDGPFTGAVTHLGQPLFFKETCIHKVYGSYGANFQIQTIACRGVQQGCEKSLAIVGETLLYKARSGIMAYDGSLPADISYALGGQTYSGAVGGSHGSKYYVSMADDQGAYHLFVYDLARGLWHREDSFRADAFCHCREELYAIDHQSGNIIAMLGSGTPEDAPVQWMAQTGPMGMQTPDMKYVSRLTLRLSMEPGARVAGYARYDWADTWEQLFTLTGSALRSFSIPIRPKRCDNMTLRIEGTGDARIYSVTKTMEQGSELS